MIPFKITVSCILQSKQQILLINEAQNGKNQWDIPAGEVKKGETVYQGILREVKEETSINIKKPKLRKIYKYMSDKNNYIHYLFHLKIDKNPTINKQDLDPDIKDLKWFSKNDVQKLLSKKAIEHKLAEARLKDFLNDSDKVYKVIEG